MFSGYPDVFLYLRIFSAILALYYGVVFFFLSSLPLIING